MIAFGPVPSRRLGHSLGINNIPPKICTYACVYCQLGRTIRMRAKRGAFYEPERIFRAIRAQVVHAREKGEAIDYLTFVPDGEPTLDLHLDRAIEALQPLGIHIAVISNASLIGQEAVRAALGKADWVSLKVDATREDIWHRIDRPHRALKLASIRDGMLEFAAGYRGKLVTETMLVAGVNDGADHVEEVADFLARLKPARAYVTIPTRPPAEPWVRSPREDVVMRAYQAVSRRVARVEYLIGYEGNAFAFTGNLEQDLLSITAVHPMREEAVQALLAKAGADWPVVHRLIAEGQLVALEHEGRKFYMRKLGARPGG
ncbi:MAG: radical SAM protein [Verrucomicrobia bacterium]|nr:radical SAM protein [Verrucomicrobiota bacterium]